MKYDAKIHHRRSIRLTHYDYSLPSAYFVTICAFGKQCIFGQVVGDQMRENECGRIVREQWLDTVRIRPQIELDAFTVMPNHLHGILWMLGPKGEHILRNTGYVIPDTDPSFVGPKSLRPHLPAAIAFGPGRTLFGPTIMPPHHPSAPQMPYHRCDRARWRPGHPGLNPPSPAEFENFGTILPLRCGRRITSSALSAMRKNC